MRRFRITFKRLEFEHSEWATTDGKRSSYESLLQAGSLLVDSVKPAKRGARPHTRTTKGNAVWTPVGSTVQTFVHFLLFFNQNQKAHYLYGEYLGLTADSTHISTHRMHPFSYVGGEKDSQLEKNAVTDSSQYNKLDLRKPLPGKKEREKNT